jgi:hypothetical protein
MEIKPTAGRANEDLPKLLRIQKNYSAISANDKAQLTKSLGGSTMLLDPSAYYLAPKPNGTAVYFRGADLQR